MPARNSRVWRRYRPLHSSRPAERGEDLARNEPGAAAGARSRELRREHRLLTTAAGLLGIRTSARTAATGARGERTVGRQLNKWAARYGWHVLHAVPAGQRGACCAAGCAGSLRYARPIRWRRSTRRPAGRPAGKARTIDMANPGPPHEGSAERVSRESSAGVSVVTPAEPVRLGSAAAQETALAVRAALDNVRQHCGPTAKAWVLETQRPDQQVAARTLERRLNRHM